MDQAYRLERERDATANGSPRSHETPLFFNELGVTTIEVGVVDFHCMGVMPPHDHPHVYLNMGDQAELLCPYCSTEYRFNPALRWNETTPANCWAAGAASVRPLVGFPPKVAAFDPNLPPAFDPKRTLARPRLR